MAWNHYSRKNLPEKRKFRGTKILLYVAISLLIIAVIIIALFNDTPNNVPSETKSFVREIKSDATPTPKACISNQEREVTPENKWPEKAPHSDGIWRHGEGPRSVAITNGYVVTYPNYPHMKMLLPRPEDKLPFEEFSDNEIASILAIKPGQTSIQVPLPLDFDQKFARSLLTKIEICEDDSPERAEQKRQVIEARKVLAEAVKRGESPRDILIAERQNLQKLMRIRDNYDQLVREQIRDGASDQEIRETITAANTLLEREGIENPITLPYKVNLRIKSVEDQGLTQ